MTTLLKTSAIAVASLAATSGTAATLNIVGGTFEVISTQNFVDDNSIAVEGPSSLLATDGVLPPFELYPQDPDNVFPLDFTGGRYSVGINGGSFDTDTGDFVATDLEFGFDILLPLVIGDFDLFVTEIDSMAGVIRGQFGANASVIDLFTLAELPADPTPYGTPLGINDRFYEARVADSFAIAMKPLFPAQNRLDVGGELFSYVRVSPEVAAVPLPASIAFLGLGLGGLGLMTRRRNKV